MEGECITNSCEHCGAIQGNFHLGQELLHFEEMTVDMDKILDQVINLDITVQDLLE